VPPKSTISPEAAFFLLARWRRPDEIELLYSQSVVVLVAMLEVFGVFD